MSASNEVTDVTLQTTEGGEARVVEALQIGASGYICKPFAPEQIKKRIFPLVELIR